MAGKRRVYRCAAVSMVLISWRMLIIVRWIKGGRWCQIKWIPGERSRGQSSGRRTFDYMHLSWGTTRLQDIVRTEGVQKTVQMHRIPEPPFIIGWDKLKEIVFSRFVRRSRFCRRKSSKFALVQWHSCSEDEKCAAAVGPSCPVIHENRRQGARGLLPMHIWHSQICIRRRTEKEEDRWMEVE